MVMSGKCVPLARYGSLQMNASPSRIFSSEYAASTALTPPEREPRCSGICVPCAISRPWPSNSATEQSRRSLMLVENDERTSVLFMSSVIERRRLVKTSIAIGSWIFIPVSNVDDDVPQPVHLRLLPWCEQYGRAHFLDHGRAVERASR